MKRNNKDVSCPYCGSKNVVAGDADWFRKSKDTLVYFLFGLAFVMVLFACLAITKLGYPLVGMLLFVFFIIGFIAQYLVRYYLDKRMIITYFCQDCHQSWSK